MLDKPGPLDKATLKVADFGLSCKLEPGKVLTRPAGTPTHMAPEVFAKRYAYPSDLWSCGVIFYVMLCGCVPWPGSTREIEKNVGVTPVNFNMHAWMDVSQAAVEFIMKMLAKEPSQRYTPMKALSDKWILWNELDLGRMKLPRKIIDDLRKFRSRNRFKRAALQVVASMLPEEDIKDQRQVFIQLDRDGDGFFTYEELHDALRRMVFAPASSDLLATQPSQTEDCGFKAEDGFTYTEFLAATLDTKKALTTGLCQAAFASFDKNKDGAISISELASGKMLGQLSMEEVRETMEALDVDGNCELDHGEFVRMMHSSRELV